MPASTRTFVAIAIPEPLGRKLVRLQSELTPEVAGARWALSLPFHATLAFLGDVRSRDLNEVCQVVAASAESLTPIELNVEGLGAFPSSTKPRVIWAGLAGHDLSPLYDLRDAVVSGLTRVGYRPDEQRFHPHVTLGRIRSDRRAARDLTELVERYRSWSGGSFTFAEVTTFSSTLGPSGPIYAPLGHAPLLGKKKAIPP
jgi:2'-5' RNA ligase